MLPLLSSCGNAGGVVEHAGNKVAVKIYLRPRDIETVRKEACVIFDCIASTVRAFCNMFSLEQVQKV